MLLPEFISKLWIHTPTIHSKSEVASKKYGKYIFQVEGPFCAPRMDVLFSSGRTSLCHIREQSLSLRIHLRICIYSVCFVCSVCAFCFNWGHLIISIWYLKCKAGSELQCWFFLSLGQKYAKMLFANQITIIYSKGKHRVGIRTEKNWHTGRNNRQF